MYKTTQMSTENVKQKDMWMMSFHACYCSARSSPQGQLMEWIQREIDFDMDSDHGSLSGMDGDNIPGTTSCFDSSCLRISEAKMTKEVTGKSTSAAPEGNLATATLGTWFLQRNTWSALVRVTLVRMTMLVNTKRFVTSGSPTGPRHLLGARVRHTLRSGR